MLSAYEFYKPQKGKRTVESDIELKSTIEMLAEVSKRIKLEQPSDILISSSPTKSKKLESASKRRRKHEALKLNKTRKRIHSPEKNNTKRSRMSNASTKGEGCIKIEIESVPDLVEEPVIEEEVINSLDLGGHLFDFLISPISMTDFAK
ncbi:unnamed protein product [Rodentolepis nana]|uniref:Uncharacterized protein n=1 Tax=Rodentolepis nana TaxID=102285 RepID=A0A0R3TMW6_RODNA|nr:unnamed protein product [Rodentolepis nana]